jgi:hypothetical protein
MLPDDVMIDTSSFSQDCNTITISEIGSVGSPMVSWNTISSTYASASTVSIDDDIVLHRDGKQSIKVGETLDTIMDRLCILQPNLEKMEQYPALKAAYDNYKMIEALIANDESQK